MTYENVIRMGADPEFFIKKDKARFATSAHLLKIPTETLATSYERPRQERTDRTKHLREAKRDGFALELNPHQTVCRDGLRSSIVQALASFKRAHAGYTVTAIPKQTLTRASIKDAPDDVMGYGCIADFNAYTMQEKSPPTTGYHNSSRYTGGHMHMSAFGPSGKKISFVMAAAHTIMADLWLSIPLVAIIGDINDYGEKARRRYYGQAGSFRHTSYGYEYRVPSSVAFMSPMIMTWSFGQLRRGQLQFNAHNNEDYEFAHNGNTTEDGWIKFVEGWDDEFGHSEIERIINEHDVHAARAFVQDNKKFYKNMYYRPFYDLMTRADDEKVPMNTNLLDVWCIDRRRAAPGVEYATGHKDFMARDDALTVFPQLSLVEKDTAWGKKARVHDVEEGDEF